MKLVFILSLKHRRTRHCPTFGVIEKTIMSSKYIAEQNILFEMFELELLMFIQAKLSC